MSQGNQASIDADRAHVFHSWSTQGSLSPLPIAGGRGATFWDNEGNQYLDFASQLVNLNLGHQHPGMIQAIARQAEVLCTIAPGFANDTRSEAARLIAERAPADLNRVFFTNGGADANEHAVRLARLATGRHKVLAAYRSYHGATTGAIALTGEPRRWPSEPGAPGVIHFFGPYLYRSHFGAVTEEEEAARSVAHLKEMVVMEGPETIAAIVLETIVGTNGVLIPPGEYLRGVRELCDAYGIMMICDEVMVGFGRTGAWFAVDHWRISPDLITFAKGVNSGYVPLGGVLMSDVAADAFQDRVYPGGLTYSGHPLACAAAVASIGIIERDGLIDRARRLGSQILGPNLEKIASNHRCVGEVRGMGCFWAIELVRSRETREMLVPHAATGAALGPMNKLGVELRRRGVWPFLHFNRLHIAPPLVITDDEAERGLAIIDETLTMIDDLIA